MAEEIVVKKRLWLRITLWVLLTPPALFLLLMALLYVPSVQDFIRQKATSLAGEASGMDISVQRIDLRFPLNLLVRGVQVSQPVDEQHSDTLLTLGSLSVRVQAWPLLRGQVEVDGILLRDATVHSSNL